MCEPALITEPIVVPSLTERNLNTVLLKIRKKYIWAHFIFWSRLRFLPFLRFLSKKVNWILPFWRRRFWRSFECTGWQLWWWPHLKNTSDVVVVLDREHQSICFIVFVQASKALQKILEEAMGTFYHKIAFWKKSSVMSEPRARLSDMFTF